MNLDIKLVELPSPEKFLAGRDKLPPRGSIIIYETSWVSDSRNKVICYVGSHKRGTNLYYGSGLQLRNHIKNHGKASLRFKLLKVLTNEEKPHRFEIETLFIKAYMEYYKDCCANLNPKAGGGGVIWTPQMKKKI